MKPNAFILSEWVDYPYDPDRILKDTLEYDPDIVAMCFGTNHAPEAKHIRKVLKEDGVRGKIFCGGIHTTLNTEEIINDLNVDFANVGEGDDSAVDLANAMRDGLDTTNIPNIWAKKDGEIIRNPARKFRDITRLPHNGYRNLAIQKNHGLPPRLGQCLHEPGLSLPVHLLSQQRCRQGHAEKPGRQNKWQCRDGLFAVAGSPRHD